MKRKENDVLIVGSAPSVKHHMDIIESFDGCIWALNDAWPWLEENLIIPDRVFVGDSRFLLKIKPIAKLECKNFVMLDTVQAEFLCSNSVNIVRLTNLGRDGLSKTPNAVFHGCSVFNIAMQFACHASSVVSITTVGVMFPPPNYYERLDGTTSVPEYVYPSQLSNARLNIQRLTHLGKKFSVIESESNLNFLDFLT